MTLEADVKRNIVKDFKAEGHYGRRIEDAFSVGFPDLILIPKGYPVFLTEAKLVGHQTFKPEPRQWIELQRLSISKHAVPTMLGWKDGIHYLHKPAKSILLKDCVKQEPDEHIVDLFKRYYHERVEI